MKWPREPEFETVLYNLRGKKDFVTKHKVTVEMDFIFRQNLADKPQIIYQSTFKCKFKNKFSNPHFFIIFFSLLIVDSHCLWWPFCSLSLFFVLIKNMRKKICTMSTTSEGSQVLVDVRCLSLIWVLWRILLLCIEVENSQDSATPQVMCTFLWGSPVP